MADYALFVGWGALVRGRETKAVKVFGESIQYYAGLQQKGIIESFEPFLLEPHGGDLNGFILIRGDKDKLAHLRVDDEFQRRTLRASTCANAPRLRHGRCELDLNVVRVPEGQHENAKTCEGLDLAMRHAYLVEEVTAR